jgi:hypothetical protein
MMVCYHKQNCYFGHCQSVILGFLKNGISETGCFQHQVMGVGARILPPASCYLMVEIDPDSKIFMLENVKPMDSVQNNNFTGSLQYLLFIHIILVRLCPEVDRGQN